MIDVATKQLIRVKTPELAGPYIEVSRDCRDILLKLLEEHGIPHWAEYLEMSYNNGPFMVVVHLRNGVDPAVVQNLLDRAE